MTESITYTRPRQEQLTIPEYIQLSMSTESKLDKLRNLTGKSYSEIIDDSIRFYYSHLITYLHSQNATQHPTTNS